MDSGDVGAMTILTVSDRLPEFVAALLHHLNDARLFWMNNYREVPRASDVLATAVTRTTLPGLFSIGFHKFV
jgi:hypothetical protein